MDEEEDLEESHDQPQMLLPEVIPSYSHLVDLYHEGSSTEDED